MERVIAACGYYPSQDERVEWGCVRVGDYSNDGTVFAPETSLSNYFLDNGQRLQNINVNKDA